ncbi:branched-chain amino acid ABC transporter permease [Bacillus sp. JJ1533]|uniref:branched-chain amino acid ABC transporter permease n=1 Tax=Bacillus sp. JJ1533 TaxID=3122959 RepID=UPI002FFFDE4E
MKHKKINIAFIALAIIIACIIPFLGLKPYYIHLFSLSLIWVIMTQGLNVIQGYTGYVSIAQASFFGIGAYSSALLTTKVGLTFWMSLPLSIIIAAIVGYVVGIIALRTKGHYFSIITMALCMVIWILMVNWDSLTGGESGISNVVSPEPILGIGFSTRTNYYYLILILTLISIFVIYRLIHSKIGRALQTIRENEQLAQAIGISLFKYKLLAFIISASFGGLSGVLYAHYIGFVNPGPFTVDYSLNAILAVILGGSGTIIGPIIGSFLMIFIPEYLRMAEEFRFVIYGLMLIVITIFLPKGIIHVLQILFTSVINNTKKFLYRKPVEKSFNSKI